VTKIQQIVIALAAIVVVLMALYPPYNAVSLTGWPSQYYGYGFLFDPPLINQYWVSGINWPRLINQWVVIIIPTLLILWVLREKRQ
jgi:hypothetical protein